MHSVRRSCQSAVRNFDTPSLLVNVSRRTFSQSCARQRGALPVYLEPSSPELSSLLSTLNSKVLLPYQLNKDQRNIVFRKVNIAKLENEPIEITLGDVTLPLEHIDRTKDIPMRWRQLSKILRQSKTEEDWENVVRAMEGFENAGIRMRLAWHEQIVRKLYEHGKSHLVLKSLQRASATGLRLRNKSLLQSVIKGIHDMAAHAGWNEQETKKAFRLAQQIVELLEDEAHCGKAAPEYDHRTAPMVVALPAEMAATLAKNHGGDIAQARKFTQRLVDALVQAKYLAAELEEVVRLSASLRPEDFKNGSRQMEVLTDYCNTVWRLLPVWNAINTAKGLFPIAPEILQLERQIGDALNKSVETVEQMRFRNGKEMMTEKGIAGAIIKGVKREG